MEQSEEEIIEKHGEKCLHCNRNTLLPYEYGLTGVSCGYNDLKRKCELSKIQRKRKNFINRLKYAEHKTFYIYTEVYNIYEGNDFNEKSKVLSTFKNKKLKLNNILIEKYKDMLENLNFQRDQFSRTVQMLTKLDLTPLE